MSSLQDKMYNHELTPPATAWEKIVTALDESLLENKFPSTLYNTEINPPATSWGKIAATLDEEQFQNEFPARLYNMEVAPPSTAWGKVAAGFNTTNGSVANPAPIRRLVPFLRYVAAAVFIGAVAYGIIKLTVNTGDKENNTALTPTPKDSSISDKNKPADTGTTQTTGVNINKDEDVALEKSKTMIAKVDRPIRRVSKGITSSVITSSVDEDVTDMSLSQSIYAYADHIPDIADRYVILMTPDGNIIRMSKKWSDLLCCVSGEEQDADCKYQLKKWQEKIATSTLAPSPGNFMDILGLVNSLNENNGL
jgi:hypothetical protein